jgi:hypothetical protein
MKLNSTVIKISGKIMQHGKLDGIMKFNITCKQKSAELITVRCKKERVKFLCAVLSLAYLNSVSITSHYLMCFSTAS